MTYNANVPNAGDSPGIFPAQGAINFTRLKTLINAEHVFNDTAQVTDGVHRQMTLINRLNPVALPAGTNGMLYLQNNFPKGYDGVQNYYIPKMLAAVTFNNTGAVQGTAVNINNIVRNGVGDFTYNFGTALPSTNGQWTVSAYSGVPNQVLVAGMYDYQLGFVKIQVRNAQTGAVQDPQLCSIIMYYGP